jgi:hypothetical protein
MEKLFDYGGFLLRMVQIDLLSNMLSTTVITKLKAQKEIKTQK